MPRFRMLSAVVEAIQLKYPMTIEFDDVLLQRKWIEHGKPGDWLIVDEDGEQYFCRDESFRKMYESVDDGLNELFTVNG